MDEKISKLFMPILDKLYNADPAGEPFRKPVDPIKYACYDYYTYVEHPIDLSTIRQKLIDHKYNGDAWRFIADVEHMLTNAFTFNKKGTIVYEFTNRLNKIWTSEISSIMQRLNYCCGYTHKFGPQLLFCHGTTPEKYCQIAIGAKYKCYQDSYSFCIPCFNRIHTEHISLQTLTCETSRMNLPTQPVKKSDFIDCTNDRWQYEAFIECTQCSKRLHQICELYPAHEEEINRCAQHEQIVEEQKLSCTVPPEFIQFAKPGTRLTPQPPPTACQPPTDSCIDAELLAFARDVDDSNDRSVPSSPVPEGNLDNDFDCAKGNRTGNGLNSSDDIRRSASISGANSTYTTCSNASPNTKNSVDRIAARLSINKLSAESQADHEKQQLVSATLKRDKFVCNHCYRKKRLGFNLRYRKFSARRLPHTRMSRYIETKVNEYIRENSPTAGEMTVRVLTAYRDKFEVKKEMKTYLRQSRARESAPHPYLNEYPDDFEFTVRAIFAWQEIDGVDVCVFGMHVQEYGEDCPEPNKQVVYLSYLDSVHFFRPKHFRTAVYHEILLSYFKYVKKLGYKRVFIWVCPSRKGDDYIFYRHPTEQKMPTLKRLSDWYVHLLDKGVANGIVERHQNIHEYAMSEDWSSILSLPYLSGDYWPGEFERLLNIMIESQKEYETKMTYCKQDTAEGESKCGTSIGKEGNQYLLNDISLDQHNVLSLSNLYQRAPSGTSKSGNAGKMINLKNSVMGSLGLKAPSRDASVNGDYDGGPAETDDTKLFNEPFTPCSSRSDDQPLDLSKSTSAASPDSYYDDDHTDMTWKVPCSRKRRRKSTSTMGYTKKRNRITQGKSQASIVGGDFSMKSQRSYRLNSGLRGSVDPIDTIMSPEEEMLRNLERSLKRQKDGFIVVHLSECDCSPHFESVRRKEESVFTCDLMKGREPFLQLARIKNYEFSTLRRAKFSSLAMVKHLGETFKLDPICNECFSFDSSKHHYICRLCEDYYLCTSCHENTIHEHKMSLLPPSMQPDIHEFLEQCPPISAANSISSASSIISNKSFNDNSPEILAQTSVTPSKDGGEPVIDNSIPLNRQMSNGLGATSSMPLGCKRQKNWALSLDSRTEDEENANLKSFTSENKLSLSHRASPPPSHSSNCARNSNLELDQVLIENVIRQTELDHNIDFDEMKDESRKLLSHYFACPIRDTCLRCKFVVLSCSFMSLIMRSSRMQMMINCHPSDMPISNNGAVSTNGNNGNGIAGDGINLTTKRRFG